MGIVWYEESGPNVAHSSCGTRNCLGRVRMTGLEQSMIFRKEIRFLESEFHCFVSRVPTDAFKLISICYNLLIYKNVMLLCLLQIFCCPYYIQDVPLPAESM